MTINFYTISDDPRTIEKTLGNIVYTCNANIFGSCSIKDPSLILKYDSRLCEVNYMEISDWGRFYFMGEPVLSPGGRCIITASEDVLYSNKDEILNLNAYCSRCENHFERYAVDPCVPSLITTNVTTIPLTGGVDFSTDVDSYQYLLTVKGGKWEQ